MDKEHQYFIYEAGVGTNGGVWMQWVWFGMGKKLGRRKFHIYPYAHYDKASHLGKWNGPEATAVGERIANKILTHRPLPKPKKGKP